MGIRLVFRTALGVLLAPLVLQSVQSWISTDERVQARIALLNGPEMQRPWRRVLAKGWQIDEGASEDPEETDARESTRGDCPSGMVEVTGQMRLESREMNTIEELQNRACTQWIDRTFPERCAVFDRGEWLSVLPQLETRSVRFCMDRFEYPNRKGAYPAIMMSWYEASDVCSNEGKRLCDEDEWTFACEGEEAMPYPYGYERNPEACVFDRPWRQVDAWALRDRASLLALRTLDQLWQGDPSGAHPACRSPFGVYDLTGNVDEWTRSVRWEERKSVMKGGYWGPVRARCRPATRAHDENFLFYQQGFRCCSDLPLP